MAFFAPQSSPPADPPKPQRRPSRGANWLALLETIRKLVAAQGVPARLYLSEIHAAGGPPPNVVGLLMHYRPNPFTLAYDGADPDQLPLDLLHGEQITVRYESDFTAPVFTSRDGVTQWGPRLRVFEIQRRGRAS